MISASSVPCPWGCDQIVDVYDDHVFNPNGCEFHVCKPGVKARALAAVADFDTLTTPERAARLLHAIAAEMDYNWRGHHEVRKVILHLEKAAAELVPPAKKRRGYEAPLILRSSRPLEQIRGMGGVQVERPLRKAWSWAVGVLREGR